MISQLPITTLFLDIGGVLLTNGWDRGIGTRASEKFGLDYLEMDERHHLTFDTYEEGKLTVENGIVVDDHQRTSAPDIFAAGDVAMFPHKTLGKLTRAEHEDNALKMGKQPDATWLAQMRLTLTRHFSILICLSLDMKQWAS